MRVKKLQIKNKYFKENMQEASLASNYNYRISNNWNMEFTLQIYEKVDCRLNTKNSKVCMLHGKCFFHLVE